MYHTTFLEYCILKNQLIANWLSRWPFNEYKQFILHETYFLLEGSRFNEILILGSYHNH